MILTPALPLSDPSTRGFHAARCALMTLVRVVALVGLFTVYGLTIPPTADPVGAGLTGFMIIFSVSGLWAIVDGWRRPLRTAGVAWVLTSLLFTVFSPLPLTLGNPPLHGGWSGLSDYVDGVTDTAGVTIILILLPAAVGLGIGYVIRRSTRTTLR